MTYRFKDEYGCFSKVYQEIFDVNVNPDKEKDFEKVYREAFEECEVL